jgi:hypothetical protein
MKLLGKWVRLADGREGHVAGATIDGYTVVIDGRIITAKASEVTAIPPPPAAAHPEPVRTAGPIRTNHEDMPRNDLSILVSGKWVEI